MSDIELNRPTRDDYMNGRATHEEFYRAVNQTAGLAIRNVPLIAEVKAALARGDQHLNSIPLGRWDVMAFHASASLSRALKAHGDFYSLGGGVCCMKQAAKDAAEQAE